MPFSNESWDKSRTNKLDAADYCRVCLIDANPSGKPKTKARCKLPVRYTPGGPFVRGAVRNAMARVFGVRGVSADKKRKAARRLVSLAREGGIEVTSQSLLRLAGMKGK